MTIKIAQLSCGTEYSSIQYEMVSVSPIPPQVLLL